jgi:HD superfamily phosphohydrolase
MIEKQDPRQLQFHNFRYEDEQDVSFFENLPYSDFRGWVPEKSIYADALSQIPALDRLGNIKCLSLLSYVGPSQKQRYFFEFTHSRLDHTLVVALLVEEILKQNKFPQDQINLGIVAGLLHDIATPAYGDATKQVDVKNLHEEDHWRKALDKKGKNFITQFGTRKTLDKIIKNQGILGKALDISDRITYTMKDLSALQIAPLETGQKSDPYLINLNKIISDYPKIGNIYKTVEIDQKTQEIYFNNPDTLSVFLRLRAHLHQKLYLHPTNQAKDLFVSKVIAQIYSTNNNSILTPNKLRKMTDNDLMQALGNYYKEEMVCLQPKLVNWYAEFEKFDSIDKAIVKEKELKQIDNIAVIGIKECKGFNPATSYKLASRNGPIEYRKYNPTDAYKIEKIADSTKGIFLFWTDISEDNPTNILLKNVLRKEY